MKKLILASLLIVTAGFAAQGHAALFLGATRQVMNTAQAEHLRAVLGGGHMAHHLAFRAHIGLLGTQVAVGVDLDLEAAVTEDAFGHHGHHVHTMRA